MKYAQFGLLGAVTANSRFEGHQVDPREFVLGLPFEYADNGFIADLDAILVAQNNLLGPDQDLNTKNGGLYQITESRFEESKKLKADTAISLFRDEEGEDEDWLYSDQTHQNLRGYGISKLALMMVLQQEVAGGNPVPLIPRAKSNFISAFSSLPNFKTYTSFEKTKASFHVVRRPYRSYS